MQLDWIRFNVCFLVLDPECIGMDVSNKPNETEMIHQISIIDGQKSQENSKALTVEGFANQNEILNDKELKAESISIWKAILIPVSLFH